MRQEIAIQCPLCGATMIETDKTFKCRDNQFKDNKQSGCTFSIFKDQSKFFGRVLKADDLEKLFASTKETPLKEEMHGIFLDKESKYFISVVFDNEVQQEGSDELVETAKTYKKSGRFVFKEFRGKKLTKNQAEKLLDGKEIKLTRKSKAGKDYKVICTLQDNGSIKAEFEKEK